MTEADPKVLTARVINGDKSAFDELVRLYHPALFRLANRLMRNLDDAQEVVQESFLAAYEGMGRFKGQSHIRTWLFSITYNKAVDRLKKATRDNWYIAGDLEKADFWENVEKVNKFTDWRANPEQNLQAAQIRETLAKALNSVPAESKAVFELRDVQGLTSREVADALEIEEGTVRVRLHRVRQYLMVAMQDFYDQEGG
ncbi:MAG: sigma-70 family RNA polymerase sigma factor, partial [SAR324 cluster bacterium]|nr:sigma-70 family RNA polymerase sigma factor [SAR324 cluster bacterium]